MVRWVRSKLRMAWVLEMFSLFNWISQDLELLPILHSCPTVNFTILTLSIGEMNLYLESVDSLIGDEVAGDSTNSGLRGEVSTLVSLTGLWNPAEDDGKSEEGLGVGYSWRTLVGVVSNCDFLGKEGKKSS